MPMTKLGSSTQLGISKSRGRYRNLSALLVVPLLALAPAGPKSQLEKEGLAKRKEVLARWLTETGLDSHLELLKLRSTSEHPGRNGEEQPNVRLELRFISSESEPTKAEKQFEEFLHKHASNKGEPFFAQSFYKLVHVLGIERPSVSLHVHVLESEYIGYFDATKREFVVEVMSNRSTRRTLSIDWADRVDSDSPAYKRPALPEAIKRAITDYYALPRQKQHELVPRLDWRPLEDDYIEVRVSRLRGEVIPKHNYWEKLTLSMELQQGTGGIKLRCFSDGFYAAGLGNNEPQDDSFYLIEKDFRTDFESYTDALLSELQNKLQAPTR